MTNRLPLRLWIETALGLISMLAALMAATMPDWIERILRFEPDGGNGSTEWGLSISLAVTALAFFADARRQRTRSTQVDLS
jgi:hypothetical protein